MSTINSSPGPTESYSGKPTCLEKQLVESDIVNFVSFPSPFPIPHSRAKETWERIKRVYNVESEEMDLALEMIGIEEAKLQLVEIAARITLANATKGVIPDPEELTVVFKGNPGVGKTTIAGHYFRFLHEFQVCDCPPIPRPGRDGSSTPPNSINRRYHYDAEIIKNVDNVTILVTRSFERRYVIRYPTVYLQDFTEHELYQLLVQTLSEKFEGRIEFQGFSINGAPIKALIKRIARNRGTAGFRNFYIIEDLIRQIAKRQYSRLLEESITDKNVKTRVITLEDILGSPPSQAISHHKAWEKLEAMIGLGSVKTAVRSLMLQLQWNYDRGLAGLPPIKTSLNRVFLGNPGTGKTTVAKLYGQILADAGFLSSSEVVVKTPADFIGAYTGESEGLTKQILEETKGKVLVIDEAYMLGSTGNHDNTDGYRAGVVDTIVGAVQGGDHEDRCVLLLGYREQMEEMFRTVNPGLARRFPMSSAFQFDDYTMEELREILDLKLSQSGLKASEDAKQVAMGILERARNSGMFANAGEVDILLNRAKERQSIRLTRIGTPTEDSLQTLEPSDIDGNFDRINRAPANIKELFSGMIGMKSLVKKLEGYQKIVKNAKALNLDNPKDYIPFNFIFRGPPGTGKTTTARKMGKVFHDLGFLATAEVVECSASDLIGKYTGQTGPRTRKVFEKALGKVLFIDEAYQLGSTYKGSFASEAISEMVGIMTQEKFHNKLVVILAGYDTEMDKLLATNPGLSSRFPEAINFKSLTPRACRDLLLNLLQSKITLKSEVIALGQMLDGLFAKLISLPFWGNARDVQTLAKSIISRMLIKGTVHPDQVLRVVKKMLRERRKRARCLRQE